MIELGKLYPGGRKGLLRMDMNENLSGCSPDVLEALQSLDDVTISMYPEYTRIISKITSYFKVQTDQIQLLNGSDEGIRYICQAFLEKNDRVLSISPTFSMYQYYTEMVGAQYVSIPTNTDFDPVLEQLKNMLKAYFRVVFLATPNNPTGRTIPVSYLVELLQEYPSTYFVIDEAYIEFTGLSMLPKIAKYDNLIVLRTFSKVYGLAGLRIGTLFSNSPVVRKIKQVASPYPMSAVACIALEAAIGDKQYLNNYLALIRSNRAFMEMELKKRGFDVVPSEANFVLVNFGLINNYFQRYLLSKGIRIRDRSIYPGLEGYSRITIGDVYQCEKLLEILDEAMEKPLVVLDYDGVVVDVRSSYWTAIKNTVEEISGKTVSDNAIEHVKNVPGYNNDWDATAKILEDLGCTTEKSAVIKIFQRYYLGESLNGDGLIRNEPLLIDPATIDYLRTNYRLAILSGRPYDEIILSLELQKIDPLQFDFIQSDLDLLPEQRKPASGGIKKIMETLNAKKGYMIGDSINDILAGKTAGINTIGISDKPEKSAKFMENGAASVFVSINEVVAVL